MHLLITTSCDPPHHLLFCGWVFGGRLCAQAFCASDEEEIERYVPSPKESVTLFDRFPQDPKTIEFAYAHTPLHVICLCVVHSLTRLMDRCVCHLLLIYGCREESMHLPLPLMQTLYSDLGVYCTQLLNEANRVVVERKSKPFVSIGVFDTTGEARTPPRRTVTLMETVRGVAKTMRMRPNDGLCDFSFSLVLLVHCLRLIHKFCLEQSRPK
jgi:hypothetical protein